MINKIIYIILMFTLFFMNCTGDGNKQSTDDKQSTVTVIPPELADTWQALKGKWQAHMSFFSDAAHIISSLRANFGEDGLLVDAVCQKDDKPLIRVYNIIPFELKEKSIVFKKSIDLKVPYKIKNDKVELPKSVEDIKNFPIDKDTLFCDLSWSKGEWQYEITTEGDSNILEIFREIDGVLGWGRKVQGSFRRKKSD